MEKPETLSAEQSGGSAGAHGSAFPTASELRTAAKVIRFICNESDEMQRNMPLLKKLWWKLTRENTDELRRKSVVIESIADRLDTLNDQELSHAAGDSRQPETRSENCQA